MSRSASTLTRVLIGLSLGRIDRDRVDERVAAQERRPHVAQRRVARRVGAVGDDQERGALLRPLRHERQRLEDGVVDGGAAGRLDRRERALELVLRAASTPVSGRGLVVERQHEELVGRVEQVEEEPVDRRARVLDALAEHAVADVEQQAEADRHALVRELRDRLLLAVLEDFERLARQAASRDGLPRR